MIKLYKNSNDSNEFLDSLKKNPLLEGYDVNVNNANDFSVYLEESCNCKNCKSIHECKNSNVGHLYKFDEDQFIYEPCRFKKDQLAKLKEAQLIKTLFVSKKILEADLVNLDVNTPNRKKIYEYIAKFITGVRNNEFNKGLYIYGSFATGKTYILGCVANELARNNIESLVIYFPDLVVELKNALGTPRFEELFNYIKSVDVLLLDDFGSENMTNWLRDDVLGPVLNYRLMEEKPVFISSNIDPTQGDLLAHLSISKAKSDELKGMRIKSRLEGLVVPVELDNNSYRR